MKPIVSIILFFYIVAAFSQSTYPKNDSVNADSIYNIQGLQFSINNLNCYWQYSVSTHTNHENPNFNIRINHQDLVRVKTGEVLISTDNAIDNNNYYNLYHIPNRLKIAKEYNLICSDINNDSYCDYKIVTERAAAGANTSYATYLYDPKNKRFEYSELFSGANIEYESDKNRISTFWKGSVLEYFFEYINLKENNIEIEFSEQIHQLGDSITYKKLVNNQVVKLMKTVTDASGNFHYLLERN